MTTIDEKFLFEDILVGDTFNYGPYCVRRDELLAFNQQWDPLPMHLDDVAARTKGHAGLTASGQYTLCVKQKLLNRAPWCHAVVGALGFDKMRFPQPVYIDDELSLKIECIESRASRSKPHRGIVTFAMTVTNQNATTVLSYLDTVMFVRSIAEAS